MCKAFSCIIDINEKVTWKFGVDSHSELAKLGGYADKQLGEFAKIEITPRNGNYLDPDIWDYHVDESPAPEWCGIREKELCLQAHSKWLKKLDKILIRKPIVNPFDLTPPKVTDTHIRLLKKWGSVRGSVRGSVGDSVWDSVGDSMWIP